jgi:hypothetical protein
MGGALGNGEPGQAGVMHERVLWERARDGDEEDLATLALREGALGLVDFGNDSDFALVAVRAMALADGWAQLPFLVATAEADTGPVSHLALESILALASRPRRPADVEDIDELREGCERLAKLANTPRRARDERVSAVSALRMMPCPKLEVTTDLDAR